jgi:hypothetical protein
MNINDLYNESNDFGFSMKTSYDGEMLFIGCPGLDVPKPSLNTPEYLRRNVGGVFIFVKSNNKWEFKQLLSGYRFNNNYIDNYLFSGYEKAFSQRTFKIGFGQGLDISYDGAVLGVSQQGELDNFACSYYIFSGNKNSEYKLKQIIFDKNNTLFNGKIAINNSGNIIKIYGIEYKPRLHYIGNEPFVFDKIYTGSSYDGWNLYENYKPSPADIDILSETSTIDNRTFKHDWVEAERFSKDGSKLFKLFTNGYPVTASKLLISERKSGIVTKNISTNSFDIFWEYDNFPDYYIDVSLNQTYSNLLSQYNNLNIKQNKINLSGLSGNQTYWFRIKNSQNNVIWTGSQLTAPKASEVLSVNNIKTDWTQFSNYANISFDINFKNVSGANSYFIDIFKLDIDDNDQLSTSQFRDSIYKNVSQNEINNEILSVSHLMSEVPTQGESFGISVIPININQNKGATSFLYKFTTPIQLWDRYRYNLNNGNPYDMSLSINRAVFGNFPDPNMLLIFGKKYFYETHKIDLKGAIFDYNNITGFQIMLSNQKNFSNLIPFKYQNQNNYSEYICTNGILNYDIRYGHSDFKPGLGIPCPPPNVNMAQKRLAITPSGNIHLGSTMYIGIKSLNYDVPIENSSLTIQSGVAQITWQEQSNPYFDLRFLGRNTMGGYVIDSRIIPPCNCSNNVESFDWLNYTISSLDTFTYPFLNFGRTGYFAYISGIRTPSIIRLYSSTPSLEIGSSITRSNSLYGLNNLQAMRGWYSDNKQNETMYYINEYGVITTKAPCYTGLITSQTNNAVSAPHGQTVAPILPVVFPANNIRLNRLTQNYTSAGLDSRIKSGIRIYLSQHKYTAPNNHELYFKTDPPGFETAITGRLKIYNYNNQLYVSPVIINYGWDLIGNYSGTKVYFQKPGSLFDFNFGETTNQQIGISGVNCPIFYNFMIDYLNYFN